MKIKQENYLYPSVQKWLSQYLKDRYKRSKIEAYDTHKISLARFLQNKGLQKYFTELNSFDIKVDITGVILSKREINLAFVECKIKPITLRDVGQILGYSRVARPIYSFIISPNGISSPLSILLQTFGRYDVLEYSGNKRIKIAKWSFDRDEIILDTLLPPGEHY